MGAPVEISSRATEDLQEIITFIAQDDLVRAQAFGEILLRKAQSLGSHPWRGRVVREVGNPEVREIVHGAYRIIYRVTVNPGRVLVLRFWHGARGTPRMGN